MRISLFAISRLAPHPGLHASAILRQSRESSTGGVCTSELGCQSLCARPTSRNEPSLECTPYAMMPKGANRALKCVLAAHDSGRMRNKLDWAGSRRSHPLEAAPRRYRHGSSGLVCCSAFSAGSGSGEDVKLASASALGAGGPCDHGWTATAGIRDRMPPPVA
jgi:hypothetical protein